MKIELHQILISELCNGYSNSDKEEKHLNIRAFSNNMKREAYERQQGICLICKKHFEIGEMEGNHIDPWHSGSKTNAENCQMLYKPYNRRKSGR